MLRTFKYLDGTNGIDIYRGEEPEFSLAEKMLTYAGEPEAGSNMKLFTGTPEKFDEFHKAIKKKENVNDRDTR